MSGVNSTGAENAKSASSGLVKMEISVTPKVAARIMNIISGENTGRRRQHHGGDAQGNVKKANSSDSARAYEVAKRILKIGRPGANEDVFASDCLSKALMEFEADEQFTTPSTSGLNLLFRQLGYVKYPKYVKWKGYARTVWVRPNCTTPPGKLLDKTLGAERKNHLTLAHSASSSAAGALPSAFMPPPLPRPPQSPQFPPSHGPLTPPNES